MLITIAVTLVGLLVVGFALVIGGVRIAIACAVVFVVLIVASAIQIRYRSARRRCPGCGANHPRLENVISDGGEWVCRVCGQTWT